jgi:hypothetical protein
MSRDADALPTGKAHRLKDRFDPRADEIDRTQLRRKTRADA